MKIIEIAELENGAHRNQTGDISTAPNGWAVVPEEMTLENFPFGDVTAEEVDGVMTVTGWTPGTIPEPDPEPDTPTELEQLRADVDYIAMETGVDL